MKPNPGIVILSAITDLMLLFLIPHHPGQSILNKIVLVIWFVFVLAKFVWAVVELITYFKYHQCRTDQFEFWILMFQGEILWSFIFIMLLNIV